MFNLLANYLAGTNQESAGRVEENIRLTSVISDDDWVLVDRDSEGNSDNDSLDEYEEVATRPTHSRRSSASSLHYTAMEESWFVTPPPCFTSAGPILMETSPLENLLIEHPSMSVYQHSQRSNGVQTIAVEGILELDDYRERQVQGYRRNRIDLFREQEKQLVKSKKAQKAQVKKVCQSLKPKYLERNNKAREVNCRNHLQRRSERSQGATRSHANNNRKC